MSLSVKPSTSLAPHGRRGQLWEGARGLRFLRWHWVREEFAEGGAFGGWQCRRAQPWTGWRAEVGKCGRELELGKVRSLRQCGPGQSASRPGVRPFLKGHPPVHSLMLGVCATQDLSF